jgi:hypothetical protein
MSSAERISPTASLAPIAEQQRRSEAELWSEFERARPAILGALLDAVAHGLRTLPRVRLDRLPRMADFAIWATACETALWPSGTFVRCYETNRRASIDDVVDADPVVACVREIMAERSTWSGTAADLLRVGAGRSGDGRFDGCTGWPKSPRELAGQLRRAQSSCGRSASTSPSLVRAAPATGSSGFVSCAKSSVPSAASVMTGANGDQNSLRRHRPELSRADHCRRRRCPSRARTMLTVPITKDF